MTDEDPFTQLPRALLPGVHLRPLPRSEPEVAADEPALTPDERLLRLWFAP